MNRRVLLGSTAIGAASFVLPFRGRATPIVSPVASPETSDAVNFTTGVDGWTRRVTRSFEATGLSLVGPVLVGVTVIRFQENSAALRSLDRLMANALADLDENLVTSELSPVSVGTLDVDGFAAKAGDVPSRDKESPFDSFPIGFLLTADGTLVRSIFVATLASDAMQAVLSIHTAIAGREPSGEPETDDADGIHSGGLWATLPTLNDVPAGLTFDEDLEHYP